MFFIGATGQLLTLLLTVFLPFVFLISGHQKVETQNVKQSFFIENTSDSGIYVENKLNVPASDFSFELQKHPVFNKNRIVVKIAPKKLIINYRTFFLSSAGNKAPPSLFCYSLI